MSGVLVAVVSAVLLLAGLTGSAAASIVLGKGAGGVNLGDSQADVRRVLGKPRTVQTYEGGSSFLYELYWVTFDKRKLAVGVETEDPKQKTSHGIGPGSSLAALRKAYPKVRCKSHIIAQRVCKLSTRRGKRVIPTRFVFFDGSIRFVDIGQVGEFG